MILNIILTKILKTFKEKFETRVRNFIVAFKNYRENVGKIFRKIRKNFTCK